MNLKREIDRILKVSSKVLAKEKEKNNKLLNSVQTTKKRRLTSIVSNNV